jgi:hypothetical protein
VALSANTVHPVKSRASRAAFSFGDHDGLTSS